MKYFQIHGLNFYTTIFCENRPVSKDTRNAGYIYITVLSSLVYLLLHSLAIQLWLQYLRQCHGLMDLMERKLLVVPAF